MAPNLVELWLKYAQDDLKSASVLLREGIYNMVCFHSQQAIGKVLKSIIAHYRMEVPRTHNLIRLQGLCGNLHGVKLEKMIEVINKRQNSTPPLKVEGIPPFTDGSVER